MAPSGSEDAEPSREQTSASQAPLSCPTGAVFGAGSGAVAVTARVVVSEPPRSSVTVSVTVYSPARS